MTRRRWWMVLGGLVALAATDAGRARATHAATGEIRVAAASDLQSVLPELAARFDRDADAHVNVSYGSSGAFFAQIQNGAPFDVFLSADVQYPRQLADSGHALADSLYEYATGRIVLWTRRDTGIDVGRGLTTLLDPRVKRIAIANPTHAPYGRAAVAALEHEHVYSAVQSKLVLGENISQAAQFVDSGNAEVGILALSLALAPPLNLHGAYYRIPAAAHPPIEQAAVVLSASRNKDLARRFLDLLRRPDIRVLLDRFGFVAPRSE